MSFLKVAFAVFIFALFFRALDYWDISQGDKGFAGIIKVLGYLVKGMALGLITFIVLVILAFLSMSGIWQWLFLMLSSSGTICFGLSFLVLLYALFRYLSRKLA